MPIRSLTCSSNAEEGSTTIRRSQKKQIEGSLRPECLFALVGVTEALVLRPSGRGGEIINMLDCRKIGYRRTLCYVEANKRQSDLPARLVRACGSGIDATVVIPAGHDERGGSYRGAP